VWEEYKSLTGDKAIPIERDPDEGALLQARALILRNTGSFVRAAAIVDHETASRIAFTGIKSRPNSALGPARRRLIKPRRKS